ncbi:MAG: hypothetical protein Q7V01_15835 [Vicinamibacterales bacterium]|nr:hypothetical protein [Vicinamibacterales bacterium]
MSAGLPGVSFIATGKPTEGHSTAATGPDRILINPSSMIDCRPREDVKGK